MFYNRYVPPPKAGAPKVEPPAPASPSPSSAVQSTAISQPRKIVFDDHDQLPNITGPTKKAKSADAETGENGDEPRRKRAKIEPPSPQDTREKKKSRKSKSAPDAPNPAGSNLDDVAKKAPQSAAQTEATAAPLKSAMKTSKSNAGLDQSGTLPTNTESTVALGSATPEEKRKKKKRSKGDVEMKDADDERALDQPVDEDAAAGRHKSILKKKDMSLKKASKLPTETQEDGDPTTEDLPTQPLAQLQLDQEAAEVHGLEPLPQPAPAVANQVELTYDTLPLWLQNPLYVSSGTQAEWTSLGLRPELGISPEIASQLASKGYPEAFAVQTAVIPRLLPSPARQGDLVISAATGSGKTLAYVLPMIRDISLGAVTKLRALIVVPTRELVQQVHEVCNICAAAYARQPNRKTVRIGTAVGNQAFKKEQEKLVDQDRRYDPEGYARLVESRQWENVRKRDVEDATFDLFELAETPLPLVNHVDHLVSKVDILICTPGRLVEHIERTPGFNLDYVRWLVVDEADKLLEQSYQQWLDVVMEKLSTNKPGCRDFMFQNKSGVRKVILSATMTRNVSLLNKLNLRQPEMIVLESVTAVSTSASGPTADMNGVSVETSSYELALPNQLLEFAIKVRDPEQKPMYLVDLLSSDHVRSRSATSKEVVMNDNGSDTSSSDDSDTSSSDSSDSDFDSDSDSEAEAENKIVASKPTGKDSTIDSVLIFTKSNESALRLSRLLEIMAPRQVASRIGTLTSTTRTSERKKVINQYKSGKLRILVASDLVARGLDLPNLDHVVNYDMPPSVRSYVHRVGRTARAGRAGRAWTFFTKTEAGWFFAEIASSKSKPGVPAGGRDEDHVAIHRSNKVETVKVSARRTEEDLKKGPPGDFGEARIAEYEQALEALGKEARGQ
ncbi:hypothetical protein MCOR25_002320 [Pyricularia grisea]|uniref:ATP-dependent RNA helicase n=1 Tax=Pyricularia grisea TaxID=148305 RepID=A0A6P8ARZ7_PYRGI|nr:uncharacterized protein PgNI_09781 [Pyricularia grisea]KAI6378074.1 hypothetical protein MCOR25_002320 [Pyricularia grisea]TLD04904.1 hypothetical protein PgNI_09781 [Pyricularia grisea]